MESEKARPALPRGRRLFLCIALFAFWIILSGRFEVPYLAFGLVSALLVTFLTGHLLDFPAARGVGIRGRLERLWRGLAYLAWLAVTVLKANLQLAALVLNPRMPIRPGLLQFRTRLKNPVGRVVLANSITLTPGTVTVDLKDGTYLVHAIVPEAARSLLEAGLQQRIKTLFGEDEVPDRASIRWIEDPGEVGR